MSCVGNQNHRWRRTETLHCRAPCSPHLGTLLMTARGLAGRRRASCGIGSEARAPTRRSGPRIASDRVSRAHPTTSCNHRAETRPAIKFHNCLLTALTSTPFARRLTVAVGRTPDGPLAHLEVLAQHQTRCEPLGARMAHKKRVTDAPYALLAAAVDRSCTNTAAAVLPGLRLVRYRRPWSSFFLSRSSRRVFLLATSLVASASISRCFSSRR